VVGKCDTYGGKVEVAPSGADVGTGSGLYAQRGIWVFELIEVVVAVVDLGVTVAENAGGVHDSLGLVIPKERVGKVFEQTDGKEADEDDEGEFEGSGVVGEAVNGHDFMLLRMLLASIW